VKAGDVIVRLGPLAWPDPLTIYEEVPPLKGTQLAVEILRDGQRQTLDAIKPDSNGKIGVAPMVAQPAIVGRTLANSPIAGANLPAGSRIVSIDGQAVETWSDVQRLLQAIAERETGTASVSVSMVFELNLADRPRETYALVLGPDEFEALRGASWEMGEMIAFMPKEVTLIAQTPWEAIGLGIHRTHIVMVQTYQTLARLFQGSVPAKALRGPVGIADIGTQIVQAKGWTFLMFFLGLISVNLAVLNFLPLPIVDGGLMVFLLIEKVKGSPVSPAVLTAANVIGLALLGSLFLFVTFHDISRLVTGG
jgi:regulator of sigma E protease